MALSHMAIRQARAPDEDHTLGDIDGLSMAVTPQSSRSWHFRYRWVGKQKRMSLGHLSGNRLARGASYVIRRALLVKDINPKIDRKYKRQAVRLAAPN